MLEVVGSSQKEAISKNFKNLLVNFRLTTVINLLQSNLVAIDLAEVKI